MKEILVKSCYMIKLPDYFKKFDMSRGVLSRLDEKIIETVKCEAIVLDGAEGKEEGFFKANSDKLYCLTNRSGESSYIGYVSRSEHCCSGLCVVTIDRVDTSRPWTLADYDNSEYVKYLDDYQCKYEELNYWERK